MSVRQAAMALRKRESRAIRYHAPSSKLAVVRSISPLTAELIDNAITLDSEDLVLSQWLFAYDEERGIEVGDTLVLLSVGEGHFIATDVVATTLMPPGPRPPNGSAGGVLGGTYPNPAFAVDMATQAELNAATAASVNDGDAAGGDLSGTFPNPAIAAGVIVNADINAAAAIARSKLDFGSGLVAGDLATGAVTSAKILDGTIADVDIAAAAGIGGSKLNWNVGSSPPGSPVDNMLWLYDGMGSGVYWPFIYRSAEATYKWVSLSAEPYFFYSYADTSTAACPQNTWVSTGVSVTIPRAGIWNIEGGMSIRPATSACTVWAGLQIAGVNPTVDQAWTAGGYCPVASARSNLHVRGVGTVAASTDVLLILEQTSTSQAMAHNGRYVSVSPRAVI